VNRTAARRVPIIFHRSTIVSTANSTRATTVWLFGCPALSYWQNNGISTLWRCRSARTPELSRSACPVDTCNLNGYNRTQYEYSAPRLEFVHRVVWPHSAGNSGPALRASRRTLLSSSVGSFCRPGIGSRPAGGRTLGRGRDYSAHGAGAASLLPGQSPVPAIRGAKKPGGQNRWGW